VVLCAETEQRDSRQLIYENVTTGSLYSRNFASHLGHRFVGSFGIPLGTAISSGANSFAFITSSDTDCTRGVTCIAVTSGVGDCEEIPSTNVIIEYRAVPTTTSVRSNNRFSLIGG
jgi:hypothetical protein